MESTGNPSSLARPKSSTVRRWPLVFIAAPAAVAIWSGWVGLAGMCGFGLVQPLPGIVAWHLDTRITLPVGVEAYGAYALGVWMRPRAIPDRARTFARRSAVGSLALGMGGQIVFHLLAAAHKQAAPWWIVMLVACLPVIVLGFGAGLTHLLRADEPEQGPETAPEPETPPEQPVPVVATDAETAARQALAASIMGGNPLSRNQLMNRFQLKRAQADEVVRSLTPEPSPEPSMNGSASHE